MDIIWRFPPLSWATWRRKPSRSRRLSLSHLRTQSFGSFPGGSARIDRSPRRSSWLLSYEAVNIHLMLTLYVNIAALLCQSRPSFPQIFPIIIYSFIGYGKLKISPNSDPRNLRGVDKYIKSWADRNTIVWNARWIKKVLSTIHIEEHMTSFLCMRYTIDLNSRFTSSA